MNIHTFFLLAPPILIGLVLHEFAHAFVADRLGDPTPRSQGRLSLNPIRHLDLFGTIALFLVHFGWAKPVQVNPSYMSNPRRDMLLVALAGPGSNVILAVLFGLILRFFWPMGPPVNQDPSSLVFVMVMFGVVINISLAVFNMIPVPPLDGSRLLSALVPNRYFIQYRRIERYAGMGLFLIMMGSIIFDVSIIGAVLIPAVRFLSVIIVGYPLPGFGG